MNRTRISLTAALLSLCLLLSGCMMPPAEGTVTSFSLEDIPAWSGEPYVAVDGNQPDFPEEDMTSVSFETYSELDTLGRCGVAYANVGQDLMPTEDRESISSVTPSGWINREYDGEYLYNRCHLIGFQLTGENANEENLITGTRYMNVDGMLPFENLVADYVKETDNHVLYRVTPVFEGQNLVASGVQMEAWSVEDEGEGVCFNVYVYNVQPGITIDYGQGYSGQGDETILNQIGAQVVADGVDVIIPVATTAAQLMTVAAEGTGIPVVYAAVSDPEQADLLDLDYVTGMSDALNTQFILDMMLAQDPEVQTVGLLYSLSEPNSTKPIAEAKEYLDGKGIAYKEYTANSVDEVIAAAGTLIADGVDAVFTPTDNKIMEAELAIAPELAEAGIPHYTGADSFVRNGAFATCGVNYTNLGTQTADLALEVLQTGEFPEYVTVSGDIITVNTDTASTLGLDYSLFQDMGSQVVEVQTTQD